MKDYTVSVEFRNKTWFDDAYIGATLAFERELNVVHTVIDGPQGFHNSVPPIWESTHVQYLLVRLHGRNQETWNIKGATTASERFNYDYPDSELVELATRVERLAPETFTTHVVMNNNTEDQGQRNAASLMRILEQQRTARVPKLIPLSEETFDRLDKRVRKQTTPPALKDFFSKMLSPGLKGRISPEPPAASRQGVHRPNEMPEHQELRPIGSCLLRRAQPHRSWLCPGRSPPWRFRRASSRQPCLPTLA